MENNEENLYMYTLVEFVTRGRRPLMKKIDIVPTLWVDYNSQTKKFFTRFLSPPYTSENVNNLHNIIKNCDYPLPEWPLYSVVLKGRAKTYEEALEKLARLEKEEHVFSLESDNNDTLAEIEFENVVKQNKLRNQAEDLKKKLAVRKLGSTSCSQDFEEPLTSEDETYQIKDQNKRKNLRKRNVSVTNLSENIQKKSKLFPNNFLKENKLEKASRNQNSILKEMIKGIKVPANINTCNMKNDQPILHQTSYDNQEQDPSNDSTVVESNEKSHESEMALSKEVERNKNNSQSEKTSCKSINVLQNISNLNSKNYGNTCLSNSNKTPDIMQSHLILQALATDFEAVKCDLKFIKRQLTKISNELMQTKEAPVCNRDTFLENHSISLPISNLAEFIKFDERLRNDDKLRVDVNSMLRVCLDKNQVITKSLVNMLKKFITAQIAIKFTSSKKVNNKFLMCNMAFFNCMKDVILLNRSIAEKSVSEKEILSSLGKVLSNARDWEGGRKEAKIIITAKSPTQDLTRSTPETKTAQTFYFINDKNQIEFVQPVEENDNELDDSEQ